MFCPYSHAFWETSQKVTHSITTSSHASLTVEFLCIRLPKSRCILFIWVVPIKFFKSSFIVQSHACTTYGSLFFRCDSLGCYTCNILLSIHVMYRAKCYQFVLQKSSVFCLGSYWFWFELHFNSTKRQGCWFVCSRKSSYFNAFIMWECGKQTFHFPPTVMP